MGSSVSAGFGIPAKGARWRSMAARVLLGIDLRATSALAFDYDDASQPPRFNLSHVYQRSPSATASSDDRIGS